jgi:peptidoglycan/xylan/chitin deacetylase (PgdA/CDA1 family)
VSASVPVLLYHSVSDDPDRYERPYAVSRSRFGAHADAVSGSGRTPFCVSELAASLRGERPLPARPVAITFDDGYANNLDAVEALLGRGLRATVYATSSDIGGPGRLSPAQVAELASLPGVEVGAHAVRHRHLDELGERELDEEVRASKLRLEDLTGVEIGSFSYPHGAYDARVRRAVIEAGYRSAVAVKNALSHDRDDVFAIARWTVTWGTSTSRIGAVIEGEGVPRAWRRERLRTRAFRAARRSRRQLSRGREAQR